MGPKEALQSLNEGLPNPIYPSIRCIWPGSAHLDPLCLTDVRVLYLRWSLIRTSKCMNDSAVSLGPGCNALRSPLPVAGTAQWGNCWQHVESEAHKHQKEGCSIRDRAAKKSGALAHSLTWILWQKGYSKSILQDHWCLCL